jgi:hypothetical protein
MMLPFFWLYVSLSALRFACAKTKTGSQNLLSIRILKSVMIDEISTCRFPPGHNAWVVGNEPVVGIDFTGAKDYAKEGGPQAQVE